MSHAALNWALEQRGKVSPPAFVLLCSLADFENGQSGKCCPQRKAIEADCGLSRKQITKYGQELEAQGLIKISHLRTQEGNIFTNQYDLLYRATRRGQSVEGRAQISPTQGQDGTQVGTGRDPGRPQTGTVIEPRNRTPEKKDKSVRQADLTCADQRIDEWPERVWDKLYPHPGNRGGRPKTLAKLAKLKPAERSQFEDWCVSYRSVLARSDYLRPAMLETVLNQERWREPVNLDPPKTKLPPIQTPRKITEYTEF